MRVWPFASFAFGISTLLFGQLPDLQSLSIQERRLPNGVQVVLMERPGIRAFHGRLILRGGRSDTGVLPAISADLLAKTLYAVPTQEKGESLEALLKQEEGIGESLRLEQAQRLRQGGQQLPRPEEEALATLHRNVLGTLKSRLDSRGPDRLRALGALNASLQVDSDAISFSLDLPSSAFEEWIKLEYARLFRLDLGYFPFVKKELLEELQRGAFKQDTQRAFIYHTALVGSPYAQVAESHVDSLLHLHWSPLYQLAQRFASPDRVKLVLVGDLRMDAILPTLNRTFGGLGTAPSACFNPEETPASLSTVAGNRRLQAHFPGKPALHMAWRVPAASHPDETALKMLTKVLTHRLRLRLQDVRLEKKLADGVSVTLGLPGWRRPCLLLVEITPSHGHSLLEVEEALHGEVLRLKREVVPEDEARKAQQMVEAEPLLVQEDATTLAAHVGNALVESGDWRRAFRDQNVGRAIAPLEIQTVARRYLTPEGTSTVLLEADPLLSPQDRLEERLAQALSRLLRTRIEDPAKAETVVRDTLRQLRMLSQEEREQTLRLLESRTRE